MSQDKPLLAFFGHHKCASTWVEDICFGVCHDLALNFKIVYEAKDFNHDLQKYVDDNNIDFIAYANADYKYVKQLRNYRGFHVVRDPRDIIVSAYFSHKHSHATHAWPELIAYREKLQAADQDEGLHMEIEFRKEQFEEMMSWPEQDPNVLEFKMEDLTQNPFQLYIEIFRYLELLDTSDYGPYKRTQFFVTKILRKIEQKTGLSLPFAMDLFPVERLLGVVWDNDFSRKSGGRKPGQEDINKHLRKGVPGDWMNHLKDDHVAAINERYSDVLKKYGYE